MVRERGFDDYKLAFVIPSSKRWKLVATGRTESYVLGTLSRQDGGVVNYDRGDGQRVIIVTAGGFARYNNYYFGSINSWANSVRVAYW